MTLRRPAVVVALLWLVWIPAASSATESATYRIDHVTDGDTVVLRNGARVRLVQIDTPEVYFGTECYGPQASATTKRLLSSGTRVRLAAEPATDRLDDFGRLLPYVIRADGVNVNLRLVALGAAAPWFYEGDRPELLRGRPLGGRADYACDLDPKSAKRVDVHRRDEPRADDPRARLIELAHPGTLLGLFPPRPVRSYSTRHGQ